MLPIMCIALVLRLEHATGGVRVLFIIIIIKRRLISRRNMPGDITRARRTLQGRVIWICWGLRQRLLATRAKFQHSVVYYATDQRRKRLEACLNAEGGNSEHLLWHWLSDIPVATHHNRFLSEPPTTTHNWLLQEPPTFERTQQIFSQMKKFGNLQVSVLTFSGGVGKWITVCFLR